MIQCSLPNNVQIFFAHIDISYSVPYTSTKTVKKYTCQRNSDKDVSLSCLFFRNPYDVLTPTESSNQYEDIQMKGMIPCNSIAHVMGYTFS